MNESRHPIDDLFKDGLEHYQLEPPMHVWERIDQKRTPVYKLTNNFKQNYRWYLSVLAGLAVMSSAAVMLLSDGNNGNIPVNAQGSNELATTTPNTPLPSQSEESVHVVNPSEIKSGAANPNAYMETAPKSETASASNSTFANNPTAQSQTPVTPAASNTAATMSSGTPVAPIQATHTETAVAATNDATAQENTATASTTAPTTVEVPVTGTDGDQALENITASNTELPSGIESEDAETKAPEATSTDDVADNTEKQVTPPYRAKNWSIDFLGSYSFTNRVLQGNDAYAAMRNDMSQMNGGFSFMFRAGYDINKNLSVRTGLAFTRLNESMKFNQPYQVTEIQNRQVTGYVVDPISGPKQVTYTVQDTIQRTEYTEVTGKNSYSFLDIPVFANYTVFGNRFLNVYASAGMYVNLRFAQGGQLLQQDGQSLIDLETGANPFNVRANIDLGFGAGVAIKPWTSLPVEFLVEPSYRLGTGSLLNNSFGAKQNFRTLNTYVGFRYRF